ncbi:MAG: AAA family ATPase [Synechococcus sp.]
MHPVAPAGERHPAMIEALLQPNAYPHPVAAVQLIETHMSWVLLTGPFAYKIKKPVALAFVQTTTLQQRLHCCHEELRLNRRLAADLYCAVVPVLGPAAQARISTTPLDPNVAHGESILDVAVKMVQFDPKDLLSRALTDNTINRPALSELAWSLGHFHQHAPVAAPTTTYGNPQAVCEPVATNLTILDQLATTGQQQAQLTQHRHWVAQHQQQLLPRLIDRKQAGAIRECHGDLHCANIRRKPNGQLQVFDAIDFNAGLRWIDPISEMAFLVMDLEMRGNPGCGVELLNSWLECTGTYDGLDLWPWYSAYRAMVRAKVSALQAQSCPDPARRHHLQTELDSYLTIASRWEQTPQGGLVLMHGLSGSGKSTLSAQLIGPFQAVRLRSDRERLRAFQALEGQPARFTGDRYRAEVTRWLFHDRLPHLVQRALLSRYAVIVDATFLRHQERRVMTALADAMGRPWAIVHCQCSEATARQRLTQRQRERQDPSEADLTVRNRQRQWQDALDDQEQQRTVVADEGSLLATVTAELAALLKPAGGA